VQKQDSYIKALFNDIHRPSPEETSTAPIRRIATRNEELSRWEQQNSTFETYCNVLLPLADSRCTGNPVILLIMSHGSGNSICTWIFHPVCEWRAFRIGAWGGLRLRTHGRFKRMLFSVVECCYHEVERSEAEGTWPRMRSKTAPEDVLSLSYKWSFLKRERQNILRVVFSNAALMGRLPILLSLTSRWQ